VPLVIVTTLPATEQTSLGVITAGLVELVVAETVKQALYTALTGAVKLTVGAIFVGVVVCVALAAV
jgi:hypothetical protein